MRIPNEAGITRFGQVAFGVALIGFGAANFLVGDFVAGRAPAWPAGMPGRLVWAYLSAVLFVTAGLRIIARRHEVRAALVVAAMVFGWALLRQLPGVMADHTFGGAWTNFGKALTLSGGVLGLAASLAATGTTGSERWVARHRRTLDLVGRCSLGAFFLIAGVQHFLFAPFVATLVPAWIPGALLWTYFAGMALIAGGIGLVLPPTARLAAALTGAMVFSWLLLLHIPRAVAMLNQNEWTAVLEALAFSGIALSMVAGGRRDAAE